MLASRPHVVWSVDASFALAEPWAYRSVAGVHSPASSSGPRERVPHRVGLRCRRVELRCALLTYRPAAPAAKRPSRPVLPGELGIGTPRDNPDIHGGNGFDVLDGRASVVSASGSDWTDGMVRAAHTMLEQATTEKVDLALLMDISAACGTQVIYLGNRTEGNYQNGPGVCAALLIRNGIPVLSQRDFRSLGLVLKHVDPSFVPEEPLHDHHESEWYVTTFDRSCDSSIVGGSRRPPADAPVCGAPSGRQEKRPRAQRSVRRPGV